MQLCDECDELLEHPHVAAGLERFRQIGSTGYSVIGTSRAERRQYQCACGADWVMTLESDRQPPATWTLLQPE